MIYAQLTSQFRISTSSTLRLSSSQTAAPAIWESLRTEHRQRKNNIQLRKLSMIKFQFIHQNLISFNRFLCFHLLFFSPPSSLMPCVFRHFSAHFIYLSDLILLAFFATYSSCRLLEIEHSLCNLSVFSVNIFLCPCRVEFDALSWDSRVLSSSTCAQCSSSITQRFPMLSFCLN